VEGGDTLGCKKEIITLVETLTEELPKIRKTLEEIQSNLEKK